MDRHRWRFGPGKHSGVVGVVTAAVSLLGCAVAQGEGPGDEVHRVGGTVVLGELAESSPNALTITTQSGSTAIVPVEDIRFVRYANEPEALTKARALLLRADGDAALDEITAMPEADLATASDPMLVEIAYVKAASRGRAAVASGSGLDQAASGLRDFAAAHPRSHHLHAVNELLGSVFSRMGRYAEAAAAFGEMAKGPPAVAARAAALRADIHLAQGNALVAIREYESAEADAAQVPGEAGRLTRLTAELGKARCRIVLHEPEDAIAASRDVIRGCRPDDTALLSRAYLVLGRAQLETGAKDRDAAVSLLTVDLVHNTVADDRAEALFLLIGLWERMNHPERARETRQSLETSYPESPWIKKLPAPDPS